jgi:UDPglucose--hexose-1-phosphate uridylyltransferase
MSQLRHNPVTRRWVIIAEERALRPQDLILPEPEPAPGGFCPFCPGNERKTPPEIWSWRGNGTAPNEPGWAVRVIPNKYPALRIEGELERHAVGIYDRMAGIGAHEVIIETPDHVAGTADLPVDHFEKVLRAYQERLRDLMRDPRMKYILIFKNHGARAGASLAHPHTQLIATSVTPWTVGVELTSCLEHHQVKERCLFCDILAQELQDGERIVREDAHYVTITPYASRFPFEMWLMPRRHAHCFAEVPEDGLHHLAVHLRDVLRRLKRVLKNPPYNFVLHTSPNTQTTPKRSRYWETIRYDYHWHLEILPRVTRVAGFEWGTGFYINPTPPEIAAEHLRDAHETEEPA